MRQGICDTWELSDYTTAGCIARGGVSIGDRQWHARIGCCSDSLGTQKYGLCTPHLGCQRDVLCLSLA